MISVDLISFLMAVENHSKKDFSVGTRGPAPSRTWACDTKGQCHNRVLFLRTRENGRVDATGVGHECECFSDYAGQQTNILIPIVDSSH